MARSQQSELNAALRLSLRQATEESRRLQAAARATQEAAQDACARSRALIEESSERRVSAARRVATPAGVP